MNKMNGTGSKEASYRQAIIVGIIAAFVMVSGFIGIQPNTKAAAPDGGGTPLSKVQVSAPQFVTSDIGYEWSSSVVKYNNEYWFFYTYNNSTDHSGCQWALYKTYYRHASSIDALSDSTSLCLGGPFDNKDSRIVTATVYDGKIYTFVSSGGGSTNIRYFVYNGTEWGGPYTLSYQGGHIDAMTANNELWLFFCNSSGLNLAKYNGSGWSVSSVHDGDVGIPRGYTDGEMYYVVWVTGCGEYVNLSYSYDGENWSTIGPIADYNLETSYDCWDPDMVKIGDNYYIFWTIWDVIPEIADSSWIAVVNSTNPTDIHSWSSEWKHITSGGYGEEYWWDWWPTVFEDDEAVYLFYTTEKNGTTMGDSEIA
ncbi:MAG TPA: hypothetical protein ENG74_00175, partial [Thermoplasmatales archaeon]|nr:hypothetical protein [Thermoplasmatales archaeon]